MNYQLNSQGAVIGQLQGKDIVEWFVDNIGNKFSFDRAALVDQAGGAELSQLRDDEVMIAPALIYRREGVVAEKLPEVCHSGRCECGRSVMKIENKSASGTIYQYPERRDESYQIFRCDSCSQVISKSWQSN